MQENKFINSNISEWYQSDFEGKSGDSVDFSSYCNLDLAQVYLYIFTAESSDCNFNSMETHGMMVKSVKYFDVKSEKSVI